LSTAYNWLEPNKNDSIIMTPTKGKTLAETMRANITRNAHTNATKKYNYPKESDEYYVSLAKHKEER